MFHGRTGLPVEDILSDLLQKINEKETVLLSAPPGAGKSTIVPLTLLGQNWLGEKKIIVLEPRRIAARSVASRMSELLGEKLGQTVGYRIRFESAETSSTRILIVTEGILIRMLKEDPSISDIGLIIFDEFHERSLQSDLSLVLSLESRKIFRPDLKIILMSATLQTEKLARFLNADIVASKGRQHPISFRYLGLQPASPITVQVAAAVRLAIREQAGDILVFLPGTGEIKKTLQLLEEDSLPVLVTPLFGDLPFEFQKKAVVPDAEGRRKVILATSVAETSLTINGVSVVIDSGLARVPRFDSKSGLTRLVTVPVTLDSAMQRAGRAGRTGPGVCYRLWSEQQTLQLIAERKPEVLEADLSSLVLDLLSWGINDPFSIKWIDTPPVGHIRQSIELLHNLNAVDEEGRITSKGWQMSNIPLHPRLSHMLVEAGNLPKVKSLACDLAALLEEKDPVSRDRGANVWLRIKELGIYRSREKVNAEINNLQRIDKLSRSWRKLVGLSNDYIDWPLEPENWCGMLLAAAYPDRIARQLDKNGLRYRFANGKTLSIEENDSLAQSEWIVVANADAGYGEGRIFLAARLEEDQIPGDQIEVTTERWDDQSEQLIFEVEIKRGGLVISKKITSDLNGNQTHLPILNKIRENGLSWAGVDEDCFSLMARLETLHVWKAVDGLPSYSEKALLERLEYWLLPFLSKVRSRAALQKLDWKMMLLSELDYGSLKKLDELAPDRMVVPSGSSVKILYHPDGKTPELHVRLQEIFGWLQTPAINKGKVKLMIHLLSPAYRPVQITQDLSSFWNSAYYEVRKELRSRYPKHSWPEDPLTALAVRGVKRK